MRIKLLGKNCVRFTVRKEVWLPLSINIMQYKPLDSWTHGNSADPNKWPWWKLFHINFIALLSVHTPSTGYRLWIYSRRRAKNFDVFFDRRAL